MSELVGGEVTPHATPLYKAAVLRNVTHLPVLSFTMPAPGFGYSVGDFLATICVIAKVISAFRVTGGASEEYRQLVSQLETDGTTPHDRVDQQ